MYEYCVCGQRPGWKGSLTDGFPFPRRFSYDREEDAGSLVDFIDNGEAEYDSASDGLSSLSAR